MKVEYIGYIFLAIAIFRFLYILAKKDEYNVSNTCEKSKTLLQSGAYYKAIALLTEALKHHENDSFLYISRGNVYFAHGQYNSAVEDYDNGIALFDKKKNEKLYYTNKEKATKQLNEYKTARENRDKARKLSDEASKKYVDNLIYSLNPKNRNE